MVFGAGKPEEFLQKDRVISAHHEFGLRNCEIIAELRLLLMLSVQKEKRNREKSSALGARLLFGKFIDLDGDF
jgi:hypothetical protein